MVQSTSPNICLGSPVAQSIFYFQFVSMYHITKRVLQYCPLTYSDFPVIHNYFDLSFCEAFARVALFSVEFRLAN